MGCVESTDVPLTTVDKLKTLVIQLKYVCGVEKSRLDMQLKKQQKFLLADFQKPLKLRNKLVEHSIILSNLVFYGEIISTFRLIFSLYDGLEQLQGITGTHSIFLRRK